MRDSSLETGRQHGGVPYVEKQAASSSSSVMRQERRKVMLATNVLETRGFHRDYYLFGLDWNRATSHTDHPCQQPLVLHSNSSSLGYHVLLWNNQNGGATLRIPLQSIRDDDLYNMTMQCAPCRFRKPAHLSKTIALLHPEPIWRHYWQPPLPRIWAGEVTSPGTAQKVS